MKTLQPVLLYGRYEWQDDLQFVEEFERRLSNTRRLMLENGWDALVIYGDSRENGTLCYLANVVPNQRWSLVLVDSERPPCIIASVGPRDLPSIKRLTWLDDIRASSDVKTALSKWLHEMRTPPADNGRRARIAVSGLAQARAPLGRDISAVCGELGEIADATEALCSQRHVKSPNELALLYKSYEVLQAAFAEVEARRQSGAGIAAAVISAERTARLAGAQDVRSLSGAGTSGALYPVAWMPETDPNRPWSIYLAVRFCGYWTEGATTLSTDRCETAEATRALVARTLTVTQPGAYSKHLLETQASMAKEQSSVPALQSGIIRAHGLSLDADPRLAAGMNGRLVDGGAYMIMRRALAADGAELIESATVFLDGNDRKELWPLQAGATP